MFTVGATVPLLVDTTDVDGNDADVSSLTVTVTQPDGTLSSPTVTLGQVGRYTATFVTTQAGRHIVNWSGTGYASSDVFTVLPADPGFILSLDDAKRALRRDTGPADDDDDLRFYLAAVTPIIEDIVGVVVPRQVTEVLWPRADASGKRQVVLARTPIMSVTSLSSQLQGEPLIDPSYLLFDATSGTLSMSNWFDFYGQIAVTYMAGRNPIPPNIILAAREQFRFMWQVGMQGARPGFGDEVDASEWTPSGFAVPRRVVELLHPHKQVAGIA